jgi:uncharacterized protein (TIGR03435 family)
MRMRMEDLVSIIAIHLDRPVVDKTGLSSKIFDFQFDQVALSNCQQGDEALDCVSPKLQEQLGLKLNARKDSVVSLMVEHVEKPTGN